MNKLWVLALLPLLAGCQTLGAIDFSAFPSLGASAAVATPAVTPAQGATTAAPAGGAEAEGSDEAEEPSVLAISPMVEFLADDPIAEVEIFEAAVIDIEEVELDEETREDSLILLGDGQAPPEDEGETTAAPEEVVFDFPVVENEKVRYFIDYYTGRGRNSLARWLKRSGRYLPMMREIFAEEGLPRDLTYLALVESGFNTRAYSWAHAVGPWQFIESTGKMYGLENSWWRDERRDFEKSTRSAARFLSDLHERFDGDWYLAVAAYNAGGGKIRRAIRKYGSRDFWEISRGDFLQAETKNYVPKLLAVLEIAKQPGKYGFVGLEYLPPLAFEVALLPTATDLEIVADLCGVPYEEIKDLNPELKRWCTPPEARDYRLRIPAGKAESFAEKFGLISEEDRANYKRHRILQGDTLLALSNRYGIRVDDIIALNRIENPRALRLGADLILPLKKGYSRLPVDEMKDDYVRSRRKSYDVRKGDSLWSISRRFGVTEKDLRVWNRLGWSNHLRPGQTLLVSAVKKSSGAKAKKKPGPLRKVVYEVKSGDSLWAIGRRFQIATAEIMKWNKLGEGHILQPGEKLTLMVSGKGKG